MIGRLLLGLVVVVGLAGAARAQGVDCDAAGTAAETRYEVPAGLLRAIGRVESGRRDPASGRVAPWSYSINAEGRGQVFETGAAAAVAVRALQAQGVASIDVGCFQVNLMHHPEAFAAVEEGFDPARNADYAARLLVALKARWGSWEAAVGAYHSAVPERGNPYRDRVLASWSSEGGAPAMAAAPAPAPFAMRVMEWKPAAGGMRIWTPSAAGRGATVIRMGGG